VWHNAALTTNIAAGDATAFRTGAGTQYLKYGAAYYPELNTTLGPNGAIVYSDLAPNLVDASNVAVNIATLAAAAGDAGLLDFQNADTDLTGTIEDDYPGYANAMATAGDKSFADLEALWTSTTTTGPGATPQAYLEDLVQILGHMGQILYALKGAALTSTTLKGAVQRYVAETASGGLRTQMEQLSRLQQSYMTATYLAGAPTAISGISPADFAVASYDYDLANPALLPLAPIDNLFHGGGLNVADIATAVANVADELLDVHASMSAFYTALTTKAGELDDESLLMTTSKIFSGAVAAIRDTGYTLPPSGAMAGAYAATDSNRGVWKAPANLSLTAVASVARKMQDSELDDLNVPNDGQGKSINAIRFFRGKGILVYGARTLAGNDNEWRYVPVRRLFIMVEESVKKATEQMVFEPNDANTWQRVRAMIGNFLTGLWRDGALVGASPEDAFFVKCGLGETMSAQDILEGKLIVEIGMAAVRPAEFIILKFSHKMQES
jgi:uncharacterized protein